MILSALFVFLGPISAPGAPQEIEVTEADPPEMEQDQTIDVIIKGNGFDHSAAAKFLVSGTRKTGGVTVNSTTFLDAQTLRANVTAAPDAVVSKYDIEVQQSKGRRGKGIELFSVKEKSTDPASDVTPATVTINDDFAGSPELTSDGNDFNHPALGTVYVDTRLAEADPCVRAFVNNTGLFRLHTTSGLDPTSGCNDSISAEQRRTFFIKFADPDVCEMFGLLGEWQQDGSCILRNHGAPRIWAENLFNPGNKPLRTEFELQFGLADVSYVLAMDDRVPIQVLDDRTRRMSYTGTATLKTIGRPPQKPQTIARRLLFSFEVTVERVPE